VAPRASLRSDCGQLAEQAGYSERAMFRLLKNIYSRLGVRNRTQALMLAKDQGWLG
jgi:DNA-binding CsgD family transcriptional regulator